MTEHQQQIVVAADGSAASFDAERRAVALAAPGGTVHLVCGYPAFPDWRMRRQSAGAPLDISHTLEPRSQAEAGLAEAAERIELAGLSVHCHARRQEPAEALRAVAREHGADAILVSGRATAWLTRLGAPCPVEDVLTEPARPRPASPVLSLFGLRRVRLGV